MSMGPALPESLWAPLRGALLRICPDFGTAEELDDAVALRMFLSTARFEAALSPDIFLVAGDRGAGKTMLFRLLSSHGEELLEARRRAVVGFALRKGGYDQPRTDVLEPLLRGADLPRLRAFWLGLLARVLRADLPDLPPDVFTALSQPDPAGWIEAALGRASALTSALDALDARLQQSGEWRFILYDDLDLLLPTFTAVLAPLRGLFALWQTSSRTWRRLRPKIFLRKDLFESDLLAFPDGAKFFAARMVTLSWGRNDLFALVHKRLLNLEGIEAALHTWLVRLAGGDANLVRKKGVGVIARDRGALGAAFMTALSGARVGEGPLAMAGDDWVIQHVTDGVGEASPRSVLRLLRVAAERAQDLLQPPVCVPESCLAQAQRRVSELRVAELQDEEPWVAQLHRHLRGLTVPVSEDDILALLQPVANQLGLSEPAPVLQGLVRRGVLTRRADGQLDVPELYRLGLEVVRRGAPERPAPPAPGLDLRELVERLFCVKNAPFGAYRWPVVDDVETLIPDVLFRVRLLDEESHSVILQLYRGLEDLGGAMWSREARVLTRLSARGDPSLPRVLAGGYVEQEDVAFILTEADEHTLAIPEAMDEITADPVEALRQTLVLAAALARLHAQGVVHRNLHPGAIGARRLEGEGLGGLQLRLARFELSALVSNLVRATDPHEAIDARRARDLRASELDRWLPYAAPEQLPWLLDGGGAETWTESEREDVYPLGVLASRWLVGPRVGSALDGVWQPGPVTLDAARGARRQLVEALQRARLPAELTTLLREMLEEDPGRRPSSGEVLRRLGVGYGAWSLALSAAPPDTRHFVGFMPDECHKTLIPFGWIEKDPREPTGREELRLFLLRELESAELLYAPDGFLAYRHGHDEEERSAFRAARYVLRGRQGFWFCDLYVPVGFATRGARVQVEHLLLIKYVCPHRAAWRLDEVALRRPVPGLLEFIPVWAGRSPDLETVRQRGSSWRPLLRSVQRSDTRPAWRERFESALLFLLRLRRVELDARCFPVSVEGGPETWTLTLDDARDRRARYADPLRALYFRELRQPMGRLFRALDGETSLLELIPEHESGGPDHKAPRATLRLVEEQDDRTVLVQVTRGTGDLPARAWVRPEADRGDETQHRRQAAATEALRQMGPLLEQFHDPRTIQGLASRWRNVGRGLEGRSPEIVRNMLRTEPFYALHGPPGTGKTTVAATAVAASLRADPSQRILVSSQSHYALDHLGERILKATRAGRRGSAHSDLVALRVASKEAESLDKIGLKDYLPEPLREARILAAQRGAQRLLDEGRAPDGQSLTPELKVLLTRWRERVPNFGLEIRDRLRRGANLVFATTGACTPQALGLGDDGAVFDWVIVEEAARAWPTELAMSLVAGRRWTLIGDHLQLPAYDEQTVQRVLGLCAMSDDEDLRVHGEHAEDYLRVYHLFGSLFEERSTRAAARTAGERLREPLDQLDLQHRMHPAIAQVVSRAFYRKQVDPQTGRIEESPRGWLRSAPATQSRRHGLTAPRFLQDRPLLWLDTEGVADNSDQRRWFNEGEARVVARLLHRMRPAPDAEAESEAFALLTPYHAQREYLLDRASLPAWALPHLHTVDSFQGREADIVVVSLVRSTRRSAGVQDAQPEVDVGYLTSPQRVNVLLSRARALLVIVGRFSHFQSLAARFSARRDIAFWAQITDEILEQDARVLAREVLPDLEVP